MERKCARVLIAAVKSGSGKTFFTCALLEALKRRGLQVSAFKCGPDYIDPMFHKTVLGVPSRNLDPFFSDEPQLRELFLQEPVSQIAVLEGAMGLYDGLGGIRQEGSAYHLADALKCPILLVVDARGMGRSLIPMLAGFLAYDTGKWIKGVILNRTSASFFSSIAPVIRQELSIPVVGYIPVQKDFKLESRHLGLKMPHEIQDLKEQIGQAAGILEETVNLDKILEIAEGAEALETEAPEESERNTMDSERNAEESEVFASGERAVIGVARDEAFCFYYEDNLRLLEKMGARLVFFSPLHDKELPEGLDGILLGGGYPELYGAELEANGSMRESIRQAIAGGLPSVAECGGFLYLHEKLRDREGGEYAMCGVIPASCYDTGKLVRFGYVTIEEKTPAFLEKSETIRAHEFHYYDSTDNGADCRAVKPVTGKAWDCIHRTPKSWWGFAHLYYPSNPCFAEHFVREAARYRKKDENGNSQNYKF